MNKETRITVFTPTYNRAHTLGRLYESLCRQTCSNFEWMVIDDGSTDNTRELIDGFISENRIPISYIYKENGGLYTGYNTAYENITTELNVCVDSDDFLADNSIELILDKWEKEGSDKYAGVIGLDFSVATGTSVSGFFPEDMKVCDFMDLYFHKYPRGDYKYALRSDLTKEVAPQIGFEGERNFNPVYMHLKVFDKYPLLVINENLCWVDYQTDSMSKGIYNQYFNSPKSFAKLRLLEMNLHGAGFLNKFRSAVHYVSSCLISKDPIFKKENPSKIITFLSLPAGFLWWRYILYKSKKG